MLSLICWIGRYADFFVSFMPNEINFTVKVKQCELRFCYNVSPLAFSLVS